MATTIPVKPYRSCGESLGAAEEVLDLRDSVTCVIAELEQGLQQAAERGAQRGLGGHDDRSLARAQDQRARVEGVPVLAVDVEAALADLVEVGQDHVDRPPPVGAAGEVLVDARMLEQLFHVTNE